jgi:hypothetical protein
MRNKMVVAIAIVVTAIIVTVVSEIVCASTVHPQEPGSGTSGESNAAIWYERAAASLQSPNASLVEEMLDIIQHGWNGQHPEVDVFLRVNEETLALLMRGTSLPLCDFFKGQPPATVVFPLPYNVMQMRWFGYLLALEGRRHAVQEHPDQALAHYLAVIRLGHHIGQAPYAILVDKMLEVAFQEVAWTGLVELIQNNHGSVDTWRHLVAELLALQAEWVGLEQVMMKEAAFRLDEILAEQWKDKLQDGTADPERLQTLLAIVRREQQTYYDALVAAIRNYSPDEFDKKVQTLQEELKVYENPLQMIGLSLRDAFSLRHLRAEWTAKILLAIALPSTRAIEVAARGRAKMHLLLAASAIRVYEREHGAPPATLADVVPVVLQEEPPDPFRPGSSLGYLVDEERWRVWSAGPDQQDQRGEHLLDERRPHEGGDVVLSSAPHTVAH